MPRPGPFQPCVHRVTLDIDSSQIPGALPALRPQGNHFDVLGLGQDALFRSLSVQGDRDRWRYAKANDYSTLRAQGNHPARPTRLPALPSSPAFTGQPRSYVSCASCTAFQPCIHRATASPRSFCVFRSNLPSIPVEGRPPVRFQTLPSLLLETQPGSPVQSWPRITVLTST